MQSPVSTESVENRESFFGSGVSPCACKVANKMLDDDEHASQRVIAHFS